MTLASGSGRDRLLAAAQERLAAGEEVRIADVCAAAGVSPGLVYKHFIDRDDLVAEAYARLFVGYAEADLADLRAVAWDADTGEGDLESALLVLARRVLDPSRDGVRWSRLEALAHARTSPGVEERIQQARERLVAGHADLVTDRPGWTAEDARAMAILGSGVALGITAMSGPDLTEAERDRVARLWARMIALVVTHR